MVHDKICLHIKSFYKMVDVQNWDSLTIYVDMEEFEAAKMSQDGEEANEINPPKPGSSGIQLVVPNNGSQNDKKIDVTEKAKVVTPKVKKTI